jgi:hypothetical protein
MNKTIEITVSPQGQTRVETKGFAGAECKQASKSLEEALGVTTAESVTSEFHQVNRSDIRNHAAN